MVITQSSNQSGYKGLPFFNQAEIISDFKAEFVKCYINYPSRTKDQINDYQDFLL